MKKIEIKTYEMGESLISAIVFLLFGIFLITDPKEIIQIALYIFGGFVAILGVFKLLLFYRATDGNKKEIINGGVFIILGMALILCVAIFYDHVEIVLKFITAIYLLYVGVNRLISAFKTKGDKKPYFINAGIIILLAALMASIPDMPLFVVGILITIYAITEIVGFVFGRKNQTEVNVNEAVIVNEQITTKEDEVKLLGNGE